MEVVKPHGGVPTWNPVLFRNHENEVLLFYKTGKSPSAWKGFVLRSIDHGHTWFGPEALPNGIIGPAKNKAIQLKDGTILSPSSREEKKGQDRRFWTCMIEESRDNGKTWKQWGPIDYEHRIIQPTLWVDNMENIRMLARSRATYAVSSISDRTGHHWSQPKLSTLPCPNSGLDAVKTRDGRVFVVYNHSFKKGGWQGRGILNLGVSEDDGQSWKTLLTLEDSKGRNVEFSYPAYNIFFLASNRAWSRTSYVT